jgi:hypothetical protein
MKHEPRGEDVAALAPDSRSPYPPGFCPFLAGEAG